VRRENFSAKPIEDHPARWQDAGIAHLYCLGMDAAVETQSQTGWQHELYDLLRENGITQIAYVPDAGHSILIDRSLADPSVHSIALTTEEEGVALIAGADLGGTRAVLLMQSSGVGNCINMLSLIKGARFPFLTLVSMRGDFGEGNPWQFAMGQATEPVLAAMGVVCAHRAVGRSNPDHERGADHGVQGRPGGRRAALAAPDRRQAFLMDTLSMMTACLLT